jgi:hypothetical protein
VLVAPGFLVAPLAAGCGGSTDTGDTGGTLGSTGPGGGDAGATTGAGGGSGASAGAATGGETAGGGSGAGAAATGGSAAATGGSAANGGAPTGGSTANGGAPTGGSTANGGAPTGGSTANGGASGGGAGGSAGSMGGGGAGGQQAGGAGGATGSACTSDADCGQSQVCAYPGSDGCSAQGSCFPAPGAVCLAYAPGCACDGTEISIVCTGLPDGYYRKPLAYSGQCTKGGADAGSTFACGDSLSCNAATEYCSVAYAGVCCPPPTYACEPLPGACAQDPSCACIQSAAGAQACSESGGGVTVSFYYP